MLRPDQVSADLCGKAQLFHDLLLSPIRLLPCKNRADFEMHFTNAEMAMYFFQVWLNKKPLLLFILCEKGLKMKKTLRESL